MSLVLRRTLVVLFTLVFLALLALLIYIPQAARLSFPQVDGELLLEGLEGEVNVYRDEYGIPHIYATTEHDLFFAQGYVHAQDRFWQMDFQRHASSGRLSEMLGSGTLDTDLFLRTLGWERVARQELELLEEESIETLQAYADGVNAYLADKQATEISLEYFFLQLLNRNYRPQPWQPLHTLTWAKAMAWDLKDNMGSEIQRAILLKSMTPEKIAELYPPYPEQHPIILPDFELQTARQHHSISVQAAVQIPGIDEALARSAHRFEALDNLFNTSSEEGLGSNSWVVSGELSATGAPLLANDPHLGASMPSIWYQNSLHCMPVSAVCNLQVSGVSFVGSPGVVIGHNQNIAWGFTNLGPDVMDLYIIRVNPNNPEQYEMNGEWLDMDLIEENIQVAGGDEAALSVRMTQFGPIISDTYGPLEDFDTVSGLDIPENYAIALRWTALEPGFIFPALLGINYAENWDDFRAAARDFTVPSQNLLYADVFGNIAYQMPGRVPIRANGDGRYPVPGWTDEYAWQGFIPFEDLPYSLNPASGFILTANNAVVAETYPYHLADAWTYGYRAQSLLDVIQSTDRAFDIESFQQMQANNLNAGGLAILPYLLDLDFEDASLEQAQSLLAYWDGHQALDSVEATIFNAFWMKLLEATFHDEIPEDDWPGGNSRWFAVIQYIVEEPSSTWWDDITSEAFIERRDDILKLAFAEAISMLEKEYGGDPNGWQWGPAHTITFEHQVMTNFPGIATIFDRGPYALPGGNAIVNANNWNASTGTFAVSSLPAKRSIMDLSNWQNSLQIHSTGQSGHAYHPNYVDMVSKWAAVDYIPMHWDFDTIKDESPAHLILLPE